MFSVSRSSWMNGANHLEKTSQLQEPFFITFQDSLPLLEIQVERKKKSLHVGEQMGCMDFSYDDFG